MKVVKVQFHKLDKEYFFLPEFSEVPGIDVDIGNKVVIDTVLGQDVGLVIGFTQWQKPKIKENNNEEFVQASETDIKTMLRPLSENDLEKLRVQKKEGVEKFINCKKLIKKYNHKAMKLVDMAESFDGKRMTFYFTSDSRVDFRDLVKDLVLKYHKKIRLQQVGVRDAVSVSGDIGSCGMPLCCKAWLSTIGSVSPDNIKNQELTNRGTDRLTGPCGRLKCCLRFEEEAYKYRRSKMPKEGDIIKTGAGEAKVIAVHPMKQTLKLKIGSNIVEYPYLEGKLCERAEECKR